MGPFLFQKGMILKKNKNSKKSRYEGVPHELTNVKRSRIGCKLSASGKERKKDHAFGGFAYPGNQPPGFAFSKTWKLVRLLGERLKIFQRFRAKKNHGSTPAKRSPFGFC
jgi:hypothetical protein